MVRVVRLGLVLQTGIVKVLCSVRFKVIVMFKCGVKVMAWVRFQAMIRA